MQVDITHSSVGVRPLILKAKNTYTFSLKTTASISNNKFLCLVYQNGESSNFIFTNKNFVSFVPKRDVEKVGFIMYDSVVGDKIYDVQLEMSSEATSYEPYHEQNVILPYTLNAIPVSSGGNVTVNGQQYIADYVDVERGKLVRMVNTIRTTQAFDLSMWAGIKENVVNYRTQAEGADKKEVLSNMLLNDNSIWGKDIIGASVIEYNNIDFTLPYKTLGIDSTATYEQRNTAVNTWLKDNNLIFMYARKTATEIDLTVEQVQALKALVTYYPTTNISTNSEQVEGYTVFNYPISLANGWNYVKKQLNDNRDYIYDMDLQSAEAYVNSEYAVTLTELGV